MHNLFSALKSNTALSSKKALMLSVLMLSGALCTPARADTANMMYNPAFDQGMNGWYVASGFGTIMKDPSQPANNIMRLSGNTAEIWENLSKLLKPGTAYTLNVRGRLSAANTAAVFGVQIYDASWKLLDNQTVTINSTSFAPYQLNFTVPATAVNVKVYAQKSGGANSFLDVDDFDLAPAAKPPQVGVWIGSACYGLPQVYQYESWLGHPAQHGTENFNQTSWPALMSGVQWTLNCLLPIKDRMDLTFGVPMIPGDGVSTLALGANGSYDANYAKIAQAFVASGYGNVTVRVGWEFNGNWQPWASYKDPANFIKLYQRIVTIFRKTPGANFKFDWCPGLGTNALAPEQSYPGDAYVDYIGEDVYDAVWSAYWADPVKRWNQYVTEPDGLQWQVDFAKAHHKPLSIPEWGVGGQNSGDNPYFVTQLAAWMKTNNYVYHSYWDTNAAYQGLISTGQYPNAAAAYLNAFK